MPISKMRIHHSSNKGDWETPRELFDQLNAEFKFSLDAAASRKNTKVVSYYTKEDNGLVQPWKGTVWVNPPYGRGIDKWVEKAIASARAGATVVMLMPARFDTRWGQALLNHADEVRYVAGRVTFVGAKDPAPFPSAIAILRPSPQWASGSKRITFTLPKRHGSSPWTRMVRVL